MPRVETMVDDETLRVQRITLGPLSTNAYLVRCTETGAGVLIDAPDQPEYLSALLQEQDIRCVLLTHNHPDHTGALAAVRALGIPLGAHAQDSLNLPVPAERLLEDGDRVPLGGLSLTVLHTPGHTPGSLSFHVESHLFSGDTLFPGGPGRTPSPRAFSDIITSIRDKILTLPAHTVLYPGHGDPTTVGEAQAEYRAFASRPQPRDLCGDVVWAMDSED